MTNFVLFIILIIPFFTLREKEFQELKTVIQQQDNSIMNSDFDLLDAYKLKIDKTLLYGKYDLFIAEMGIPSKVTITKTDYVIHSKAELDNVISAAKNPQIVTLHYPGIDMWYVYDNSIVPSTIDFRKTDKSITYNSTAFNILYSINEFKRQFPISANPSFKFPQSLFETMTKEKGENFEHYLLGRKSKDDPDAAPMVEFTFEKGKLIFILFANF